MVSANSGGKLGRSRKRKATDESEDEEEEGGEEVALRHTQDQEQNDNIKRATLVKHMDPDQTNRFAAWRASKLQDSTVRRVCSPFFLFYIYPQLFARFLRRGRRLMDVDCQSSTLPIGSDTGHLGYQSNN